VSISKVILFGEYAAVHRYLCDGLRELGVSVKVIAGTSGWRKNQVDVNLSSEYSGVLGKLDLYSRPFRLLNSFTGHDVVQFIDYHVFVTRFSINDFLVKKIIQENSKSFLIATGCDIFVNEYYKRYESPICDSCLKFDKQQTTCPFIKRKFVDRVNKLLPLYNSVIPTTYEYAQAYRDADVKSLLPTLPLPVNMDHILYKDNIVFGKIVIFHGINRIGFKGTEIISDAFKVLQYKYPKHVEVVIKGQMPYSDYLNIIQRANIIVDQLFNEGFGMNALISMAMGKITVCGDVTKTILELNINETSPTVSVYPTVEDIVNQISKYINNNDLIAEQGYQSMAFVKKYFNHINVAEMYLESWGQVKS
jgi:glycosyltransferase involved in cell wall biosynthesis